MRLIASELIASELIANDRAPIFATCIYFLELQVNLRLRLLTG